MHYHGLIRHDSQDYFEAVYNSRKTTVMDSIPLMQSGELEVNSEALSKLSNMGLVPDSSDQKQFSVLSFDQVKMLNEVMNKEFPIHGRGNFPTLEVKLKDIVSVVRSKLEIEGIHVQDIRLNGGAASHILAKDCRNQPYNDLDLIFAVDLSNQSNFEKVKSAVLESLMDLLPEGVSKKRMSACSLKDAYVHKMVKVNDGDRWSLISLSNTRGRNVELKFVDNMRRQFEFSVDSFQILLDSLLLFYECAEMPISESFYPTVVGESVYGDFSEALEHLNKRLIATKNPEEIRGGGLLKYCNLLIKDYKPFDPSRIKTLERYMCSRFFIDFPDIHQQQNKLETYLCNHFVDDEDLKYEYLMTLYKVVDESTVCLMSHERRLTLSLIEDLACGVYYYEQGTQYAKQHGLPLPIPGNYPIYPTYIITSFGTSQSCSCTWMSPCRG